MQHNNDEEVSLKELWDRFYQLRDVEIKNLWKRTSIFAGFIGLLFAGYGYIFLGSSTSDLTVKHAWSCGIATLGIIFSIFWIALAKGAKAWIGVHERKICEIEAEEELGIPARFCMGELSYPGGKKEPNNNLLSIRPGFFSVSKLNILLGQVLLICWSLIGLVHALPFVTLEHLLTNIPSWVFLIVIILFLIVILIFVTRRAKSESLLSPNKEYKSAKERYKQERIRLLKNELKSLLGGDKSNLLLEKIEKDSTLSSISEKETAQLKYHIIYLILFEKIKKDSTLSFILDKEIAKSIPDEARKRIKRERERETCEHLEKEEYKEERINLLIKELKSLLGGDKSNLLLEKIEKDSTLSSISEKETAQLKYHIIYLILFEKIKEDSTLSFILDKEIAKSIPYEARKRIEREREMRAEPEKKKKKWVCISFLINLKQQIKKHLDI